MHDKIAMFCAFSRYDGTRTRWVTLGKPAERVVADL